MQVSVWMIALTSSSIRQIVTRLLRLARQRRRNFFRVLSAAQRHSHLRRRARAIPLSWERRDSYGRFGRCQNFWADLVDGGRGRQVSDRPGRRTWHSRSRGHAQSVCSSFITHVQDEAPSLAWRVQENYTCASQEWINTMRKIYTWLENCVPVHEEAQHWKPSPTTLWLRKLCLLLLQRSSHWSKKLENKRSIDESPTKHDVSSQTISGKSCLNKWLMWWVENTYVLDKKNPLPYFA